MPHAEIDYFVIPERVDQAALSLREARFDLLHYWEIGTDSLNYFLPFFRPARLQSATWGWPMTSGNPAIDFYVSSALIEPEDGETHYRERLIRLEHLPTYYVRPPVPQRPREKEEFGFKASQRVYLCQQNVRKYHPDFDPVLADILRGDPTGVIACIGDEQPAVTAALLSRWRRTIPDVVDRIQVMKRLNRNEYLSLVASADLLLDTPHYGGGANTVFDAIAAGTPLLTWTGPYHRGRWATAINRCLGRSSHVAQKLDDYAKLSIQQWLQLAKAAQQSPSASDEAMFSSQLAVRELERFFTGVTAT
jgi:predicted O-linked N-acetylglucosamine transferase (SPINDLY family)